MVHEIIIIRSVFCLTVNVVETGGSNAFNFSKILYTNTKDRNCTGFQSAFRAITIQAICRNNNKKTHKLNELVTYY